MSMCMCAAFMCFRALGLLTVSVFCRKRRGSEEKWKIETLMQLGYHGLPLGNFPNSHQDRETSLTVTKTGKLT